MSKSLKTTTYQVLNFIKRAETNVVLIVFIGVLCHVHTILLPFPLYDSGTSFIKSIINITLKFI